MADNTTREQGERIEARPVEPASPAGPLEEEVVRGREAGTPFVLLGGVMATVWAVVALVALGLLALWWLA